MENEDDWVYLFFNSFFEEGRGDPDKIIKKVKNKVGDYKQKIKKKINSVV